MTPDEVHVSEDVAVGYAPPGGEEEIGWITGASGTMVLVRYAGHAQATATRPEGLEFLSSMMP